MRKEGSTGFILAGKGNARTRQTGITAAYGLETMLGDHCLIADQTQNADAGPAQR
jgi:hypothetical protein